MNDPNQAYGGNLFEENENNGWAGASGYDLAQSSQNWGVESTAYHTEHITNAYAENPYEINVFDTPYTETFSQPNPTHDYSINSGFELD